jgi:hypothetical protein
MESALERENPVGGRPTGLQDAAIERVQIIPPQPSKSNILPYSCYPRPGKLGGKGATMVSAKLRAHYKEIADLERAYTEHSIKVARERREEERESERIREDIRYDRNTFLNRTSHLMTPGARISLDDLRRRYDAFIETQRAKGRNAYVLEDLEREKERALKAYRETLGWYAKVDQRQAEDDRRSDPRFLAELIRAEIEKVILDMIRGGVLSANK